jgi:hypothetical protein
MKNLVLLFLIIFVGNSCASQKTTNRNTAVIEYEVHSRGLYQKILVKDQTVWVSKSRDEKPVAVKIPDAAWKELISELKKMNLDSIPNLKAPTQKRFYDGAAIANLKITYNGKTYEAPSFDHGEPHSKIKKIVNKLRSFVKEE